ncbi:hypothetical protein BT93_B0953 [Corymbia citriodora subsp. variegata]|nr:hypothetical protein BT93_B0953 [Corymbia citriodora subsp. variegata]
MQDASGMIGRTEAKVAFFPPHPSLTGTGSIYSMAKHKCTLTRSLPRDRSIQWNR